jgi:hypothetical protein
MRAAALSQEHALLSTQVRVLLSTHPWLHLGQEHHTLSPPLVLSLSSFEVGFSKNQLDGCGGPIHDEDLALGVSVLSQHFFRIGLRSRPGQGALYYGAQSAVYVAKPVKRKMPSFVVLKFMYCYQDFPSDSDLADYFIREYDTICEVSGCCENQIPRHR